MTPDYEVDVATLARLTDFVLGLEAVSSVCIGVHLAESHSLSTAERKLIAEVIVGRAAGRVGTIVSVGSPSIDESLELGAHAKAIGADAVIAVPPYHSRLDQRGLRDFYSELAGALDVPLLAYHVPSWQAGVGLTPETIVDLAADVPGFIGVKDASFSFAFHAELLALLRRNGIERGFEVSPSLEWCLPTMPLGSRSVHSAAVMFAPRLSSSLYAAVRDRRWAEARPLFVRFGRVWSAIYRGFPWSIKAAMEIMGRPVGPMRPPHVPAPSGYVADLRAELEALGVLQDEPRGWV